MSRTLLAAAVAALTLSAAPARAQFEGRLDYLMKGLPAPEPGGGKHGGSRQDGKITMWVSAAGARSEMSGVVPDGKGGSRQLKVVMLWKASDPKKTVMLNDAQRTYSVMDRGDHASGGHAKRKLERLGSGSVAGYACEKVRLSREGGGGAQELCVTKALGSVSALARMSADDDEDVFSELRAAGLDGIPVSMRTLDEEGGAAGVTLELTAAKKQAVPASTFQVPAGYQQTGMAGVFASPEQQKELDAAMKQMQERMKSMTPEQRKQMEEMMKRYGGGK
ncbi:MAG: DUF4412 domain-containing protein [Anaeromyxobacter sp.]